MSRGSYSFWDVLVSAQYMNFCKENISRRMRYQRINPLKNDNHHIKYFSSFINDIYEAVRCNAPYEWLIGVSREWVN